MSMDLLWISSASLLVIKSKEPMSSGELDIMGLIRVTRYRKGDLIYGGTDCPSVSFFVYLVLVLIPRIPPSALKLTTHTVNKRGWTRMLVSNARKPIKKMSKT